MADDMQRPMLTGLNHLTLSVADVSASLAFYRDILGCRPLARWDAGAYLSLGDLWLCLSHDRERSTSPAPDYTHYAFSIGAADFVPFVTALRAVGVREWKNNRSEGKSIYFLDPDGHKLEAHVGDVQARLAACRLRPYAGMVFFD